MLSATRPPNRVQDLYTSLANGDVSLTQAHSLAILDVETLKDCHPKDELPILQIIETFYRTDDDGPRILGLISAPMLHEFYLDSGLLNLEALLDAKVLGVSDDQRRDLLSLPSRPTEAVVLYDSPFHTEETALYQKLHKLDQAETLLRRHFKAAKHALVSVGACASDLVWRRALKNIDAEARPWYEEQEDLNGSLSEDQVKTRARNIIKNWPFTLPVLDASSKGFNLTPKFIRLLRLLRSCEDYGDGFRCIVFGRWSDCWMNPFLDTLLSSKESSGAGHRRHTSHAGRSCFLHSSEGTDWAQWFLKYPAGQTLP